MKIVRWLSGFATAVSLLVAAPVMAQSYPNKPIRLIVPFGPGSGSDILARIVAEPLGQALGQPIIIENKPGNNTTLGTELVVSAPPDGYTLGLLTNSGLVASPAGLTSGVRYDPAKDLSYISLVASVSYVWLVNNDVDARTAPELIKLIKANSKKYNYASGNTGGIAYGGYIKNAYRARRDACALQVDAAGTGGPDQRTRSDHGRRRTRIVGHDPGWQGPGGRHDDGPAQFAARRGDLLGTGSRHAARHEWLVVRRSTCRDARRHPRPAEQGTGQGPRNGIGEGQVAAAERHRADAVDATAGGAVPEGSVCGLEDHRQGPQPQGRLSGMA